MNASERWPALQDSRADDFRDLLDIAAGMTPAQLLEAAQSAGRDGQFQVAILFLRLVEVDIKGLVRVWGAKV